VRETVIIMMSVRAILYAISEKLLSLFLDVLGRARNQEIIAAIAHRLGFSSLGIS